MPYSKGDKNLPSNVKNLPKNKRDQWVEVWNSVYNECNKNGEGDCEAKAFKQANGVVKKKAKGA